MNFCQVTDKDTVRHILTHSSSWEGFSPSLKDKAERLLDLCAEVGAVIVSEELLKQYLEKDSS